MTLFCFSQARAVDLDLPVKCSADDNCFIWQYVDIKSDARVEDYRCSVRSYNGHKGTDFHTSFEAMQRGVPVVAAAAGTVIGVRDGMRDIFVSDVGVESVSGKECGNGAVIDHGNGWQTQYCHLRRGSLKIRKGQTILSGEEIGLIGVSGKSDFPHLHLTVRRNETVIDPFDPYNVATCKMSAEPLWTSPDHPILSYKRSPFAEFGFARTIIPFSDLREGLPQHQIGNQNDPVLIFYAMAANLETGDHMKITVKDPDGNVLVSHSSNPQPRKKARYSFRAGKRRKSPWQKGHYEGIAQIFDAQNKLISEAKGSLTIQ